MDSLLDRIRRSAAQRGCLGTAQLCAVQLLWLVLPRFRRTAARRVSTDVEFDQKHGVDTAGVFRPKPGQVLGNHWAFGSSYQPVEPAAFLETMRQLQLPYPEFTFIDFGCGKGRTLLLASLFPFKSILGVEYCPELTQVARHNALAFRPAERVCPLIEALDADAAEFAIPAEPLVLFFYNPFSQQVMSRVIANVLASYRQHPRRILVVYFFPQLAALWESTGVFVRTRETPAVFDTAPVRTPITTRKNH